MELAHEETTRMRRTAITKAIEQLEVQKAAIQLAIDALTAHTVPTRIVKTPRVAKTKPAIETGR